MNKYTTPTNGSGEADFTARPNRRIFRSEAIDRYCRDHQRSIIPRFVQPRTFIGLWLLLALILLCCGLIIGRIMSQHTPAGIGFGPSMHSSAPADCPPFARSSVEGAES